jgi:hypothetical protein
MKFSRTAPLYLLALYLILFLSACCRTKKCDERVLVVPPAPAPPHALSDEDVEKALRNLIKERPYLLLTVADVNALRKRFEPEALDQALQHVADALPHHPANSMEKQRLYADPLGISGEAQAATEQRLARLKRVLRGTHLPAQKIIVESSGESQAYAGLGEVSRRLQSYFDAQKLKPAGSILDLVPPPAVQQATLDELKAVDIAGLIDAFKLAARKRFGDRGQLFFRPFLKELERFGLLTRQPESLTLAGVVQTPLGPALAPLLQIDAAGRVRLTYFAELNTDIPELEETLERNPPPGTTIRLVRRGDAAE